MRTFVGAMGGWALAWSVLAAQHSGDDRLYVIAAACVIYLVYAVGQERGSDGGSA